MLKKILIGLCVLLAIAGGAAYWIWSQATALPDWYAEDMSAAEQGMSEASPPTASQGLQWAVVPDAEAAPAPSGAQKAKPTSTGKRKKRRVIRDFHMRARVSSPAAKKAFRASRATYEDGHLEAGVIVNTGKVSKDELSKKDKGFFDRLVKAFPPLAERDVYVALEDEPIVAPDGILQLGKDPKVRVGKLGYSLDQVARKLGVSPKSVRRDINAELRRMKVMDPEQLERLDSRAPG